MRRIVAAVLLLSLVAATPATKPTTEPIGYPAMQRKITELLAQITELKASNKKLADENASLASEVKMLQPPVPAAKDVPFGVGWEGPIGKARVLKRVSNLAAVLLIRDAKGEKLGEVYVSNFNVENYADDMEIVSTQRIHIDQVMQEIPAAGIYHSILFSRIP